MPTKSLYPAVIALFTATATPKFKRVERTQVSIHLPTFPTNTWPNYVSLKMVNTTCSE